MSASFDYQLAMWAVAYDKLGPSRRGGGLLNMYMFGGLVKINGGLTL